MSECKHRWVSGPRQWPVTCSDCGLNKSDVQINTLTAQRDELLAACEKMLRYLVEQAESMDMLPQSWPMVANAEAAITKARGDE